MAVTEKSRSDNHTQTSLDSDICHKQMCGRKDVMVMSSA